MRAWLRDKRWEEEVEWLFVTLLRSRDGGLSLASFRYVSKISLPATTAGSLRVETVVTGEARQYLENGRQEISEMKECLVIM